MFAVHTDKHTMQHVAVLWIEPGHAAKGPFRMRPDQVSPSCCLIIDLSGIVFSIVSIMMALV